jgi:hypothetical protein
MLYLIIIINLTSECYYKLLIDTFVVISVGLILLAI